MQFLKKIDELAIKIFKSIIAFSNNILLFLKESLVKSQDLTKTNYELGILHLKNGNLSDAILRFKLVNFFSENYQKTNYHLARCFQYNLEFDKAINLLKNDISPNAFYRLSFMQQQPIEQIPLEALTEDFDFFANSYHEYCKDTNYRAYSLMVEKLVILLDQNNFSFEQSTILELGFGTGLVGQKLKSIKPEINQFDSIEISDRMIALSKENLKPDPCYTKIINQSIEEFINKTAKKFDLIIACNSLHYSKDLDKITMQILNCLEINGYFAFVVEKSNNEEISFNYTNANFSFSENYLKKILTNDNIKILSIEDIAINDSTNGVYCIVTRQN